MQQLTVHICEESLNADLDFEDLLHDIGKLQQRYQHAINKNDDSESVSHEVRFGFVQWIYYLAVMITGFMADVVVKKGDNSKTEVFILNILGLMQKCKTIITKFNFIFTQISQLFNTTIDIFSNSYLLLPLDMAAHIFQLTSLFMGMLLVLAVSASLVLLTPLAIMLIISILLVTLSISAINTGFTQLGHYINIHAPKRALLVYFADKIPPSVGRVEISHQRQRKDYDKISKNND